MESGFVPRFLPVAVCQRGAKLKVRAQNASGASDESVRRTRELRERKEERTRDQFARCANQVLLLDISISVCSPSCYNFVPVI